MLFRMALSRAARQRADLTEEQREMLRKVTRRPRLVTIDGQRVRFDAAVEQRTIAVLQRSAPALLASALIDGASATAGAGALVGKIDWGKLLDWLVQNLPKIIEIIMSLIALF